MADADRTALVATHDERLVPLADRAVELTPRHLLATSSVETLEQDDGIVLFKQGDVGSLVYIVDSVTMRLTRDPLFKMPRSSTARALGKTVVTGFPLASIPGPLAEERICGSVIAKSCRRRSHRRDITTD
jgi:putative ABC transport system ATP-binding protein